MTSGNDVSKGTTVVKKVVENSTPWMVMVCDDEWGVVYDVVH